MHNQLGMRLSAQDLQVVPTAAARAMLGHGGVRGSSCLVPAGRDVPIGLNIERFLGTANPFGLDPFAKPKHAPDEEEVIRQLLAPSEAMAKVLSARLSHLRIVAKLWGGGGGPARALLHALDMDDPAVLVDLLGAAQPRLHTHVTLELATDLAPAIHSLLDSEYEDYVLGGLSAAASILKAVGPVVRDTAEAAQYNGGFRPGAVDVHLEEKQDRCAALAESLAQLLPRLEGIASGKGRSAQLAARVLKSLNRVLGFDTGG